MQHENDLIAQQQRRRRLQRLMLALPWAIFALVLTLLAVRPHLG
jgi:hypothetical protein